MATSQMTVFEDGRRQQLLVMDPNLGFDQDGGGIGDRIDLRAIWSVIYRNRGLALIIIALSLVAGLASIFLTVPIYRAGTTVQIEQQSARVLEGQDASDPSGGLGDTDRFLQTQLDIVQSRSLAERVAESLGLARNSQFMRSMGVRVGNGVGEALGSTQARRDGAVALLRGNMKVDLPRNSRVVSITFDSPDPAVAARIANSYAENFIVSSLQRRYEASSYARNFLQQQLAEAKQRLEDAERASIAYARSARLIDASAGSGGGEGETGPRSLVTSTLVQLNGALSTATANRIGAQQRWQQTQSTPVMSLPEVQGNSTIQTLVAQRAQLQATMEEQRTRRKDDFPEMRQAQARITELDQQINRLAATVKTSVRDQFQIAQRQETALRSDISRLKGETMDEQDRGVQLNILRREVDTSRTLYDGLLQRYKEVSAAAGITANNISIIDKAELPGAPILPRPLVNIALALLGGMVLAVIVIFARETFDDAIRSPEDVDQKLGTAFLGSVPVLPQGDTPQMALGNMRSAFSEAYYALRSSLEFATSTGLPRSLLCTSSQQGEGKSTTSLALAQSFARIGRRVLLIDADLRKPSLHRLLNLPGQPGLTNVLTRQETYERVVQPTETPNLSFLACGPLPPNPAELLAGGPVRDLLDDLVKHYDLVLIDGPPVMGLADAPILAAIVEGTIFVVEAGRAHRGQAKIALRRLRESRAVIVGSILTKFDSRAIGYGEDYGYSYSYGDGGAARLPKASLLGRRKPKPADTAEGDAVA